MSLMDFQDAIKATEGKLFITINGKTLEFGEIVEVEAKVEFSQIDVPVLGRRMKGKKQGQGEGTGSIKYHYKQSVLRDVAENYIKTGIYPSIDIQAINDDPSVPGSRIVHNLRGCIFNTTTLNKISAEGEDVVFDETDFSFNDYAKM